MKKNLLGKAVELKKKVISDTTNTVMTCLAPEVAYSMGLHV